MYKFLSRSAFVCAGAVSGLVAVAEPTLAASAFGFELKFVSTIQDQYKKIANEAAETWTNLITGYKPDVQAPDNNKILVDIAVKNIDNVDGILGGGTVTSYAVNPSTGLFTGGFAMPSTGEIEIDIADIDGMYAAGTLDEFFQHELAHVMGFGITWDPASNFPDYPKLTELTSVYKEGTGKYTGAAALAAYRTEFSQPTATYIPIELEGGDGTANGHWDEVLGGLGPVGITNPDGLDMALEIMTGWENDPGYISMTTIKSFEDIGYLTASSTAASTPDSTAVPTPAMLPGLIGMGLSVLRRKHKQSEVSYS